MKILNKNKYFLDFKVPFKIGNKTISQKEFVQYKLQINDRELIHNISCIPSFHGFKINELEDSFEVHIDSSYPSTFNEFISRIGTSKASLNYAHESLWLRILPDLPNELSNTNSVNCNGLYVPGAFQDHNYEYLKVKVGRQNLNQDIDLIKEIQNKNIKLRLDANRSLDEKSFIQLIDSVDLKKIEYFEEPFIDRELLHKYKNEFNFALDESLLEEDFDISAFNYLIIKPTLLGYSKTLELIEKGKHTCIISSTFENAEMMKDLYRLANYANTFNETHHGLGTLDFFK